MGLAAELADAWADLWLGGRCAGCERPGRSLCRACARLLQAPATVRWPLPAPAGMPLPMSVAAYDGPIRQLLIAHKEHSRYGLHRALGEALAGSAAAVLRAAVPVERPVTGLALVPVPSRGPVVRERGHDPLLRMTRVAAARLRAEGTDARVLPALRQRRRPADQAGLGSVERAANLRGAFDVRNGFADSLAARPVVVTDDILTTGATAAEAARALTSVGALVCGLATVAATERRVIPGVIPGVISRVVRPVN